MSRKAARDDQGRRRCTRCLEWKDEAENFELKVDGLYRQSNCRSCRNADKSRRAKERRRELATLLPKQYEATPRFHDHLSDVELAYIAGLVDGEGCISSCLPSGVAVKLAVAMVHRPTIEYLHSLGGGCFGARTLQPNCRQAYHWILNGRRAYSLLLRIAPFMHTKREEAEVACQLAATHWSETVERRSEVAPEVKDRRVALGRLLREIKKREWVA